MVFNTRWSCGSVLAVACLVVLPGCVTASKYMLLQDELARVQEELGYTQQNLEKAEGMLLVMEGDQNALASAEQRLAALELEKADLARQFSEFRTQHAALSAQGIETIVNPAEGMIGWRAKGDVLFSSGSDKLTDEGKRALDSVVQELQKTAYPIRIDGHTDTDPVRKTKDKFPRGNIQLGAERAISVRAYLIEKGIEEGRVAIASFGPHKPVRTGTDGDSKSRNRRVEIMLQLPTGSGS